VFNVFVLNVCWMR